MRVRLATGSDIALNAWTASFAYDVDLENAADMAEPLRSTVEVRGNVMAWKSFSYHLVILTRGHRLSGRCIGVALDPDVE